MPTLTPSYLPPPAISAFQSSPCASSNGTRFNVTTPTSPKQDAVTKRSDPPVKRRALKIPFVKLDTPIIQEDMAASLAVALLGHVLFLKNQVPLCAASLITICRTASFLTFLTALFLVPLHSWGAFPVHRPHRARPRSART